MHGPDKRDPAVREGHARKRFCSPSRANDRPSREIAAVFFVVSFDCPSSRMLLGRSGIGLWDGTRFQCGPGSRTALCRTDASAATSNFTLPGGLRLPVQRPGSAPRPRDDGETTAMGSFSTQRRNPQAPYAASTARMRAAKTGHQLPVFFWALRPLTELRTP